MRICPKCGFAEKSGASFCGHCGFHLLDPNLTQNPNLRVENPETGPEPVASPVTPPSEKPRRKPDNHHLTFSEEKPKKQRGPMIAGIAAILLLVCVAVFFFVTNQRKIHSENSQIEEHYQAVKDLCQRQRDDYLEEAVDNEALDEFDTTADSIKDSEDTPNQTKINRLKNLREKAEEYDTTVCQEQQKSLDESMKALTDQKDALSDYMLEGEDGQMDGYEKNYASHIDDKKFRLASDDVNQLKDLEERIADTSESKSKYSAKKLLLEEEFIPKTLDFSVDAETYTAELTEDHFTLFEQVGNGEPHVLPVKITKAKKNKNMIDYQLVFETQSPKDYESKRGYRLHVRNKEGTKGFDAQEGTIPSLLVKKAVQEKLKEFVKAFNQDCSNSSYSALKPLVQSKTQAESKLSGITTSDKQEAITDSANDFSRFKINSDNTVSCTIRFTYRVGQMVSYDRIRSRPVEEAAMRRDVRIETFRGTQWAIYEEDGVPVAGERVAEAKYAIDESLNENDSFSFNMTNTGIKEIYQYDFDSPEITEVHSVKYVPDKNNAVTINDLAGYTGGGSDDASYTEEDDYEEEYDDEEY